MPATLGTLGIWITANMGPLSSGLQQASAQVHRFSTATRGVFQKLNTNVEGFNNVLKKNTAQFGLWAAAGTILFMRLLQGTLDFQRQLAYLGVFLKDDIAGGLGTVEQQLKGFKKEITKIGIETGQPFVGLTEGLSALIQAEIPAEEALIRLRAAAKFTAIVGAEATDSVAAIVKIMRTFGMSTEETNEFFNKLLEAIRIAPVPAKEFLDALVSVATAGGLINASFPDVLTLFTQLTYKTKSVAAASTIATRAFEIFPKHGIKATKTAKEQGIAYDSSTVALMGLANWLATLGDMSDETIAKLTEEKRARIAVATGVRELNDFLSIQKQIIAATGETLDQKFNFYIAQTPGQLDIVKNELIALKDEMVDTLLVALSPMIRGLSEFIELLKKVPTNITAIVLGLSGLTVAGSGLFFLIGLLGSVAKNIAVLGATIIGGLIPLFPLISKGFLIASTHAWRLGGTASSLTLWLKKLGNEFGVLAFAPGLAGKAIEKFANLSKDQAAALAIETLRVGRGMKGINQAAATLAPTLGITAIEAKKMITTMKGMGAVSLPQATGLSKAWNFVSKSIRAFGNALLHPIAVLGTLGGIILRVATAVIPRFIGALRIVMSFFGPIGWIIGGLITLLAVAFPGSLSRLGTIFVETLKLILTLAKVVFHGIGIAFSASTTAMGIAWETFIGIIPNWLKNFVHLIQNTVIRVLDWVIEKLREVREFLEFFISEAPAGITFAEAVGKRAISAQQLKVRAQQAQVRPEAVLAGLKAAKPIPGAPDLFRVQIKGLGSVTIKQEQLNAATKGYSGLIDELRRKEADRTAEAVKEGDKRLDAYRKEFALKTTLLEQEFAEIFKLVQGDIKLRAEALKLYQLAKIKAEIEDERRRQDIIDDEAAQERLRLYERLADIETLARTDQEKLLLRAAAYKSYQEKITDIDKERFQKAIEPLLEYIELQEEAAGLAGDFAQEQFFAQQRISLEAKKAEKETGSAIAGTIAKQKGTIELEDKRLDRVMKRADEELKTGKKIARSMEEEDEARRQFIEQAQAALKQYSQELEKMGMRPEAIEEMDQYQNVLRAIIEEMEILDDRSTGVLDAIMRGFEDAKGKAIGYLERLREATREVIENIRTTLSDFLFDWVTGELESIQAVFKNFLRGIIRAITDFITDEIVRKFLELLQDIFKWERKVRIPKIVSDELRVKKIIVGGEEEEGKKAPEIGKTFSNIMQTLPEIFGGKKGKAKGTPPTFPGGTSLKDFMGMQNILGNILGDFSGKLKDIFGNMSGGFKDILGNILGGLKGGLGDILSSLGGGGLGGILGGLTKGGMGGVLGIITKFLPFLPFQEGGIVKSPVLGMLGEKGPEAVIPLDRMGSAPISLQFNINTLDGANFAEYLRRNADILSTTIVSDILRNKNIRKTLIRMG